ncbi:MAG: YggS family pyridoxal phosphate-dependent enzyme [Bdellovibrionales bacterium]|nr:YggS family pyridoxal phosphate-dependent enzyme [Bdellovibrionales bacterium]
MDGVSLPQSFDAVKIRVAEAAKKSGRQPEDICLVAVSKLQPLEKIETLGGLGQRDFGENYVQEWLEKSQHFSIRKEFVPRWHLIGPLQRNKVKFVVGKCELIQSVDRLSLAEEISEVALEKKCVQDVLIQVRIGDELTKSGADPADALVLALAAEKLKGIRVRGMMVLPPMTEVEAEARLFLKEAKGLFDSWKNQLADFSILSIGTSHDFSWAIEEGSNMVRVGTILFGSRPV